MSQTWINFILLGGAFLILFAMAEVLYHRFKWKAEHTRKLVHLVTGLLTLLFPLLLGDRLPVLLLCGSFLIILIISLKTNLLKSINGVDRITRGSILYPIIVSVCYLLYWENKHLIFFYLPILVLAVCDPLAALVGKRTQWIPYTLFGHTKTVGGSLAFFLGCISLSLGLFYFMEEVLILPLLIPIILMSLLATVTEAISHLGYDNFTIPLAILSMLYAFEYFHLL